MNSLWIISIGLSLTAHALFIFDAGPRFTKRIIKPVEKQIVKKDIPIFLQMPRELHSKPKTIAAVETIKIPVYAKTSLISSIKAAPIKSILTEKPLIIDRGDKIIIMADIPQDAQLQNIPKYMDFYRLIREKIKEKAYHNYDIDNDGEVFLSFIIDKSGKIDNLRVNSSSCVNSALRQIAFKSVKSAAPFPDFPNELKSYSRLPFNISISFQSKSR